MSILQNIRSREDLLVLSQDQRQELCSEIRAFLVESLSKTGGHLASNLGVVELSVALETVYDTHTDRLVFDVGHQSYVHKLLTGRQAEFAHLRQFGGMAGFPKPSESDADAFVAGHASSSISIALGMARARTLLGESYDVVTVIGDGAATGGMVYEALNDVAVSGERMVIILNDNEMSIAPNVGGFARHLRHLRTKDSYLGAKQRYRKLMSRTPFTKALYKGSSAVKNWLKRIVLPTTIFENMGLTYLGPVDGNDLEQMIGLLTRAKTMNGPVLIHVTTQKGRGYAPAEAEPSKFHGVSPFDTKTGLPLKSGGETYSSAFGAAMCKLAEENDRICAITAAMPDGTGLAEFMNRYPNRTFDVGIAEEHAVSMAGGMAKQGLIPVVAMYSTFLQRSYDQIMQDIALLGLHVVFCVDRAGLVGEDGETHHGIYDTGYLRQIPGMQILCPASTKELEQMLFWAVKECTGPVAIRYPRGGGNAELHFDGVNLVQKLCSGLDAAIVTYGMITAEVMDAAWILKQQGINVTVLRLQSIAPLPIEQLAKRMLGIRHVFVVEETAAFSGISKELAYALPGKILTAMDLGDSFVTHGSRADLLRHYGLDAASLSDEIREVLQ